jgi:hypothetical protein
MAYAHYDLSEVCHAELLQILKRRHVANLLPRNSLPEDEPLGLDSPMLRSLSRQLVGLALSGGGTRAACFHLGLLQSLQKCGFLRYVDYLATVGGGSYVSAYLSSKALAAPRSSDEPSELLSPKGYDKSWQLPLRFVPRYVFGLLFNLLIYLVGAAALSSAAAFLWRWLDILPQAEADGFAWAYQFLPALILLVGALASWPQAIFHAARPRAGRVDTLYGFCLLLTIVFFLIGGMLFLGNRDLRSSPITLEQLHWLSGSLVIALALCLLPFLWSDRLLAMGVRPKNQVQVMIFRVASFALVFGVPLCLTYLFGRQDFAGGWRDYDVKREDVLYADQLLRLGCFLALAFAFVVLSWVIDLNETSLFHFYRELLRNTYLATGTDRWADAAKAVRLRWLPLEVAREKWDHVRDLVDYDCETGLRRLLRFVFAILLASALIPIAILRTLVLLPNSVVMMRRRSYAIPLSELDTTSQGAPYHLILGTLNGPAAKGDRRPSHPFLFSHMFCGADVTGYLRTLDYWGGELDLADAMTISGVGAELPAPRGARLFVLMMMLNKQLGQWLPDPRSPLAQRLPNYSRALVARLLLDCRHASRPERRAYRLISNGCHDECPPSRKSCRF